MKASEIQCRRFEGKAALVLGASSGIGEAVARRLSAEGAALALLARREARLSEIRASLEPQASLVIPGDVTHLADVRQAVAKTMEAYGKLDVLVNCAGRELLLPLLACGDEDVEDLLHVNMVGVVNGCKAVYRKMATGGAIINIGSAAALKGSTAMALYAMTKAGVAGLSRSLAAELAPRKIRVNSVSPGMVKTDMFDRLLGKMNEEQRVALEKSHLLGFGHPDDVAAAVAFLASADAAWITGIDLVVDGGFTC